MLTYNPDDEYWNAVSLLLPHGNATLIDVNIFERYGHLEWQVMGTVVFHNERYSVIVNPTARPKNRKERVRYRMVTLPRMILGVPYDRMADHINRQRFDNRRQNLRVATGSQNSMNRPGIRNKTSQFKGVHRSPKTGKWITQVTFEGNQYGLGTFTSEIEAALAYNAFIKAHCAEFGYLNPICGATADEEPTTVKMAPKKRWSRIKKLTPSERRVKKMRASVKRQATASKKARASWEERMAKRTPEERDADIREALQKLARANPELYPHIKIGALSSTTSSSGELPD